MIKKFLKNYWQQTLNFKYVKNINKYRIDIYKYYDLNNIIRIIHINFFLSYEYSN